MLKRLPLAVIMVTLAGCASLQPAEPTGHRNTPHGTADARSRPTATAVSPRWSVVGDSGSGGSLVDVVATTAHDAWTVGYHNEVDPSIMRWSGGRWRDVRAPEGAKPAAAVVATSPSEVWVFDHTARAWRWNGTGWTSMGGQDGQDGRWVSSAAASGPDDVWVAGSTTSEPRRAFVGRWSGGRWSESELPAGVSTIYGISATSPDDVWAISQTTVLHWDGRAWTALTMGDPGFPALDVPGPPWPGDGTPPLSLRDVDAVSPNEVWAVGTVSTGTGAEPVALRFDGDRWTALDVPAHPDHAGRAVAGAFSAVTADGHGGFWAAAVHPVSILHHARDGGWTDEGIPPQPGADPRAVALARVPGGDRVFAVGGHPSYDEDSSGWIWTRSP